MQIDVAKRDLEAALKIATFAMASGQTTDLQSHYLFHVEGGEATVRTHSRRTFCGTPLKCKATGDGSFSIEGWRIRQWLTAVRDVALTFKFEDGVVEAISPRGKMLFSSMDPSKYPSYDGNLAEAEVVSETLCARAGQVFSYIQPFVLDRETSHPQMSLTEVNQGCLYATNLDSMTVIRMSDTSDEGDTSLTLGSSEMRIHVKDVGPIVGFLKLNPDLKVEVLEHKGVCLVLRREDGSVFGAARPQAGFPRFPPDVSVDTQDEVYFELSVEELTSGITWLKAGAKRDADHIRIKWVDNSSLVLAMEAVSGGEVKLPIDVIEHDGMSLMPKAGFKIPHAFVTLVSKNFTDDKIKFGIVIKVDDEGEQTGKGYVRFRHEEGGDVYQTLVAWT